jgi:hypothetical protein
MISGLSAMVLSSVRFVLRKVDSLPRGFRGRRARFVGLAPSLAGSGSAAGRPRSGRSRTSSVVERVEFRGSARRQLWLRSPATAASLPLGFGNRSESLREAALGDQAPQRCRALFQVFTLCRITPRLNRTLVLASTTAVGKWLWPRALVMVGLERRLGA